jgi:hypothetical protein
MFHKQGTAPIIGTFESEKQSLSAGMAHSTSTPSEDAASCADCQSGRNCALHGHVAQQPPPPPDRPEPPKPQ